MAVKDSDLLSIQQARTLAAAAREAQKVLAGFSQEQVDRIVEAMAAAARAEAERLARMAHEETGFGNTKDKTLKNLFSAVDVFEYIRPAAHGGDPAGGPGAPGGRDRGAHGGGGGGDPVHEPDLHRDLQGPRLHQGAQRAA